VLIDRVLSHLGLLDGDNPICPGCKLTGDSSVAIVGNGIKCSHARCSAKGYRNGFRTPVDVWSEARRVDPKQAVSEMAELFGFEGFRKKEANASMPDDEFFTGENETSSRGSKADPLLGCVSTVSSDWIRVAPPPREYLLTDVRTGQGSLVARSVALLAAAGGAGKSFAQVSLALTLAHGTGRWLGVHAPSAPGRVLMVSAEDPVDEIRRRLFYVAKAYGYGPPPERSIDIIDIHDRSFPLLNRELRPTNNFEALQSYIEKNGPYACVMVDPLGRLAGCDLDSSNEAAAATIGMLESLSAAANGGCIATHHTDKAARRFKITDATATRGPTGLTDFSRAVIVASITEVSHADPDVKERLSEIVTFGIRKANHVKKWDDVHLRRGPNGELISLDDVDLAIVRAAQSGEDRRKGRIEQREAEREQTRVDRDRKERERKAQAEEARATRQRAQDDADDEAARRIVSERPGITSQAFEDAICAALSCGSTRARRARTRAAMSRPSTGQSHAIGWYPSLVPNARPDGNLARSSGAQAFPHTLSNPSLDRTSERQRGFETSETSETNETSDSLGGGE
jgi:RecA-family ATPase